MHCTQNKIKNSVCNLVTQLLARNSDKERDEGEDSVSLLISKNLNMEHVNSTIYLHL